MIILRRSATVVFQPPYFFNGAHMNVRFRVPALAVILLFLGICFTPFTATEGQASEVQQAETPVPATETAQPDSEQPQQPSPETENVETTKLTPRNKFISKWLHMLDSGRDGDISETSVMAYGPQVPADLLQSIQRTDQATSGPGFWGVLFRALISVGLGFLLVIIFKRVAKSKLDRLKDLSPPKSEITSLLWAGLVRNLPAFAGLVVLAISSTIIFLLLAGNIGVKGRMLFQLILGVILAFQFCSLISNVLFSPEDKDSRPFELDESLVKPLSIVFKYSLALLLSGVLFVNLVQEVGARPQSVSWVVMILGSVIIALYCYMIVYLTTPVATALISRVDEENGGWIKRQVATYWHVLALLYLAVVWFVWIGQQMTGTTLQNGQLIISMLIVPIYFGVSHGGRLLISAIVESMELGKIDDDDDSIDETERQEDLLRQQTAITAKAYATFRLVLITVMGIWVLSLWGYDIPFATAAMSALFQSIVVLALALIFWRLASSYIERKLEEAAPDEEEKEDTDDEFGGAVVGGRTHTLLPMLRKVIGTILVVMVILIVISSLGVNIGPLLAGAGVLGLAIGFGAQKLVSDILSGFFFLLDDAFRVGEYIQAGSIRGTVEAITLRNVMLRHHRGMLQVVPHSDLGAITNYMRGGIVIKFPLEFPYDTDIEKVRKIIKKVGVAMLADDELGDDFILPVKSQGVYEITNSVMVIRVKFTAKPGKQFVIKREAFRRITESLNAKGIYYAHRKVIVDFPEGAINESADQLKIAQAAAAALLTEEQQQKADPTEP